MPSAELHKAAACSQASTAPTNARARKCVGAPHPAARKRGASRPLPAGSRNRYICPRQPLGCACPPIGGRTGSRHEETRMAALDHVSMNGGAPFTPPQTADEAREYIRANGIEFLFAQFVDMHGKPNAKLVPASHLDDLLDRGRRLRRLRRRRHRPAAELARTWPRCPTSARSRRCRSGRASPASPATCTSRARSGRTARARSSAASSTGPRRSATSSRSAPSSSTSSCARRTTARSSSPTSSTPSTSPVTTCAP